MSAATETHEYSDESSSARRDSNSFQANEKEPPKNQRYSQPIVYEKRHRKQFNSQRDSCTKHSNGKRESKKGIKNKAENDDVQLSKSLSWVLRHAALSLGLCPTPDGYIPVEDVLSLNHPRFQNLSNSSLSHLKSADRFFRERKYTLQDVIRVVKNNDKQRFRLEYKDQSMIKSNIQREGALDSCGGATQERKDILELYPMINSHTQSDTVTQNNNVVLCIRANQGHSFQNNVIESNKLLTLLTKEELSDPGLNIIHGTTQKAWENHIRVEGLNRMKRNHIHFATGLPSISSDLNNDVSDNRNEIEQNPPISGMRASSQIYIYINSKKCAAKGIQFFRSDNGVILTSGINNEGLLPVQYFKKVILASSGKVLHEEDNTVVIEES